MEWIRNESEKENYAQLLVEIMVAELLDILGNDFETNGNYKNDFMTVHRCMLEHLDVNGRQNPNAALEWCKAVENLSVIELRRKKLYLAPIFIDAARAYLSVQASSAAAEGLFSDAGHLEGTRRTQCDTSVTEMLLFIRSYVKMHLSRAPAQKGFLSGKAGSVKSIAVDIARYLEGDQY